MSIERRIHDLQLSYQRGDLSDHEFRALVLAVVVDPLVLFRLLTLAELDVVWDHDVLDESVSRISVGTSTHQAPEREDAIARTLARAVVSQRADFGRLDFQRAAENLVNDAKGDWFKDPWALPEVGWLTGAGQHLLSSALASRSSTSVYGISLDVPKSAGGTRPATVLDPLGRLLYQALVDSISPSLSGDLPRWAYGWRLKPDIPTAGEYAHNDLQWKNYVRRLGWSASANPRALRADVASFFASVDVDRHIPALAAPAATVERIHLLVSSWNDQTRRTGLPQRCLGSSVLANAILTPVDARLKTQGGIQHLVEANHPSATRWMDDFWLFESNATKDRELETSVREGLSALGLSLNEAKTCWLEGQDLHDAIQDVDFAYELQLLLGEPPDPRALMRRATNMLARSRLERTEVNFLTKCAYREELGGLVELLVEHRNKLVSGLDRVCQLFRRKRRTTGLHEWFTQIVNDSNPWVRASSLELMPTSAPPSPTIVNVVSERALRDTEYVVVAGALKLLSAWVPAVALDIIDARKREAQTPALSRVLALAAFDAGMPSKQAQRLLVDHEACYVTLSMMRAGDLRTSAART